MKRRIFLGALLVPFLTSPAFAKKKKSGGGRKTDSRQPNTTDRVLIERTRDGWRTPTVLAIGTIIVLADGQECKVVDVYNGYSWCVPAD